MDAFLKTLAAQQGDKDITKTFVAIEPPSTAILGYYTLCAHNIDIRTLPAADQKRFPKRPVGAVYLSMIGVDSTVQRRGLGAFLLTDVFTRCVEVARTLSALPSSCSMRSTRMPPGSIVITDFTTCQRRGKRSGC
jgi:ribosomal protein S18 acetylase RimI-like enzyme